MTDNFTPGPWLVGEYDEHLGYDCMTGGVRAGPVCLDGNNYGQKNCTPLEPEALARMMADAHLIAAAPQLLEALRPFANYACDVPCNCHNCRARAAIKAAEGDA